MTRQDNCCRKLFCCKQSSGKVGAEDQDDLTAPFVPKDEPSLNSSDAGSSRGFKWFSRRVATRPDASGPAEKARADWVAEKAKMPSVRWMDLHGDGDGGGDSGSDPGMDDPSLEMSAEELTPGAGGPADSASGGGDGKALDSPSDNESLVLTRGNLVRSGDGRSLTPSSDDDSLFPARGGLVPTLSERRMSHESSTKIISFIDLGNLDPDDDADDAMLEAFARRYDDAAGR